MRKARSNYIVLISIIIIFIFLTVAFIALFFGIKAIIEHQDVTYIVGGIVGFLLLLPLCFMSICVLNRGCCNVYFDSDKKRIIRKGFIIGYKCIVNIDEIRAVEIVSFREDGFFYVIIDKYDKEYSFFRKDAYILIKRNRKNEEFIRLFWDKPFENNDEIMNGLV